MRALPMITQTNVLRFATMFVVLLFAPTCWGQAAHPPMFNTASAGVAAADIEAAVATICSPRDITRSKAGAAKRMPRLPEGTDFSGDGHSTWEMYAETPGHFTSPQDDNLILDGTGCDSHANNFGGSFVFTLKSGKPRLLKYDSGLITDECHKFTYSDGRDFLVCRGGWGGMGENDGFVFAAAFDATGKSAAAYLIKVTDTTATCGDDPAVGVQESDIKDIKFSTKDSGEITGLTVTATLGYPKCSQVKAEEKTRKPSSAVKTYEIEFLFDGKHFQVAPASKAALERFKNS